jgi:hypothetical protein
MPPSYIFILMKLILIVSALEGEGEAEVTKYLTIPLEASCSMKFALKCLVYPEEVNR